MTKNKGEKEFLLGGQAVIEGVMMRSPNYYTVAVRTPDGNISLKQKHHPHLSRKWKWAGWPFIRGVMALGQTMSIGLNALSYSAEMAAEEDEKGKAEINGWTMFLVFLFAIVFAFGLVVFLPLLLTDLTISWFPALDNPFAYNTIDGVFRVIFFLTYISLISLMPDIKRVFQYHGAEHMSVHANEAKEDLIVEKARNYSPYHPRCGTSFLLLVMIVAIVIFSFTPHKEAFWVKLLIRTPLIPVIAGVSYEVLRLTAKLRSKGIFSFLSAPGMWLQRLTAKQPDDDQLEVGLLALKHVIALENNYQGEPIPKEEEEAHSRCGHLATIDANPVNLVYPYLKY